MNKSTLNAKEYEDLACLTRSIKLFSGFNMEQLETLVRQLRIYCYEPGEYVCRQGEPGDAFYIIYEGSVSVFVKPGFFSRTRKVAQLGPGEVFGEMAMIFKTPRMASVQAGTPLKLFVLEHGYFDAVARWNPQFYDNIRQLAEKRRKNNSDEIV
ncbi:MAG: cyclic nucleotide-binding domain-containing protein [Elusimicrobia bacterium]|nr:cyclic nucleotide-binding domain-containing protein [Elusimicrobiota bacterium]